MRYTCSSDSINVHEQQIKYGCSLRYHRAPAAVHTYVFCAHSRYVYTIMGGRARKMPKAMVGHDIDHTTAVYMHDHAWYLIPCMAKLDSGYERFSLVWKSNCISQPKMQQPNLAYTDNPQEHLWENALGAWKVFTATLKCICSDSFTVRESPACIRSMKGLYCICSDSFTDVLRVVSVLCL